jgi:hypothetical protein
MRVALLQAEKRVLKVAKQVEELNPVAKVAGVLGTTRTQGQVLSRRKQFQKDQEAKREGTGDAASHA